MKNLNPYDILGIPDGSSKEHVKLAYKKMLIKTHPDKMNGNAKYFMMVHEAYTSIMKSFEQSSNFKYAPKTKTKYEQNTDFKPNLPENLKDKFSSNKFNNFFEKNRINDLNPFTKGYSKYMSNSLQHQEEVDALKKTHIKTKKRQVIIYKDPEPINELYTENYSLLGHSNINDYSCNNGTDYMKAYMQPEKHIDTSKKYKNLNHITQERSSQSFELSEEDKMYMFEKQKRLRKLEQYRMQNMTTNDDKIAEKYTTLNNLLN